MSVSTLLAVDDRPDNLFVLEQLVQAYLPDIKLITAKGAEEGLALAASGPIDGALIDVQMPGMDGYEVCRILRKGAQTRHIPIVMLTAADDPALNRKAFAAGAQACVPKPFRREGLIAAIEIAVTYKPRETPPAA